MDSETLSDVVFHQHLVDAGVSISHNEASDRYIGWRMTDIIFDVRQRHGIELDDAWLQRYRKATYAVFEEDLKAIPHVKTAVGDLIANEIPICVGSSGSVDKMQTTLGITGLLELFEDKLFSGWNVPNGKPAPDVFLHAADHMGFQPSQCVVIEDSAAGVQAGLAAKMLVLGFVDPQDIRGLAKQGVHTFTSMRGLPRLLGIRD